MSRVENPTRNTRALLLTGLCACLAVSAVAQDDAPEAAPPVDAAERQAVVQRMGEQLVENYVFPDVAEKVAAHVKAELTAGAYDEITDAEAFADALTEAARSVSHDKHMRVRAQTPRRAAEQRANPLRASAEAAARQRQGNYGFDKVEILDGNVGYLNMLGFAGTPDAQATAVAAMTFLANVDAIIFDMRENGGGSPEMVRFVSSYLFDQRTHLNSLYWRQGDRTDEFWTLDELPSPRLGDGVPVFVLTSSYTFSGAEEFSYNLRTRDRATLVGETTGGGANPGGSMPVGERFRMFIPTGRAINPITGTNWEGVGVEPHVKVEADKALEVALPKAQEAAEARRRSRLESFDAQWARLEEAQQKAQGLLEASETDAAQAVIKEAVLQALSSGLADEGGINQLGYIYLQRDQGPLAIAAFQANVESFPDSPNTYDSLGEAYMETGLNEAAIKNYRKSLELDPGNRNAVGMLERLGAPAPSDAH